MEAGKYKGGDVSSVSLHPVRGFFDRLRFLKLQRTIQAGDPCFVPQLTIEMLKTLSPRKNPFFRHAEAALFLARRDGRIVGRIAAIVDHLHDKTHRERCGFFGYFECENSPETARVLLDGARHWLRERGAQFFRGPVNLSLNNECGLLIEGFDTPPPVMTTHNPPYYRDLLEAYGFKRVQTLLGYRVRYEQIEFERLRRVATRVLERGRFTIRKLDMRRFSDEVATIGKIFNEAWADNWGFVPSTEEEFRFSAASLRAIVDPDMILFAEKEGKPVAFIAAIPDANVAIKAIDGKLFPFGIFRLPGLLKRIRQIRLPLFGVTPSCRQAGIEGALLLQLIERGGAKGYHVCDCSWILEQNTLMRRPIESIGGKIYKRYWILEMGL